MNALLLTAYNRLELTDVPRPELAPHDVLVRVATCGICGSDVHGMDGSTGRRIPPLIMGHEAAGTIVDAGAEVDHSRIGQRVALDSTISCGRCSLCLRGHSNLCAERRILGVACDEFRRHGAFAELVAVPGHVAYPLPEGLPFEHAAFVEPISVAVHAVDRAVSGSAGDGRPITAVVVGTGMIGLLVVQAAREAGCRDVIAIDVDPGRLALARELGATALINSRETDALAAVGEQTNGQGADVAIEVVGTAEAINTAIRSVGRGGRVALVGNVSPEVPLPLQGVVTRELTLVGSCAAAGEYRRSIELVANGAIRVAPLISAIAPLADGPGWFARLRAREPGLLKVILQP